MRYSSMQCVKHEMELNLCDMAGEKEEALCFSFH